MPKLLPDLEQLETAGQGGDLPEHPIIGVFQFQGQRRLSVRGTHPRLLATLRQHEGEHRLVLGLPADVQHGADIVHKFRSPRTAIHDVREGLAVRDLLSLRLAFMVNQDGNAPRLLKHRLQQPSAEVRDVDVVIDVPADVSHQGVQHDDVQFVPDDDLTGELDDVVPALGRFVEEVQVLPDHGLLVVVQPHARHDALEGLGHVADVALRLEDAHLQRMLRRDAEQLPSASP